MKYKRKKNYWQQDIHKLEYLTAFLQGSMLLVLISYLFYDTWKFAILFSPYLIRYIKSWKKKTIKKREQRFRLQFKEAIQSLSTGLNVGYSVENALVEAHKELKGMYRRDELMLRELTYMIHQIRMNVTSERAFQDLAARTADEDVQTFVTVFNMAKRSGGDMMEIIRNVVHQMGDKIDVEREIQTVISAKKMELRIMTIIPLVMIVYLKICFSEFMEVLYGNVTGIVIMSICLVIYLISYEMGKRMVEIEV